ncbi:MAG: hypothetical protein U0556_20010 [Dehalococcoidia bacterium]
MPTETLPNAAGADTSGDYVDIGKYLSILVRRWYIIVGCALLGAVAVFAYSSVRQSLDPVYTSDGQLLLTGSKYQIRLDERIVATDRLASQQAVAQRAREVEYRALLTSVDVSRQVAERLKLPADSVNGRLDAKIEGNVITLSARASTPGDAEALAQAFGQVASQRLDEVYGQSDRDVRSVEEELQRTNADLAAAETRYVAFLREARDAELRQQLSQKQLLRQNLTERSNDALVARLRGGYAVLTELDLLRSDALTLRQQIAAGGESSAGLLSSSAAILSLESRLFNLNRVIAVEIANGRPKPADQQGAAAGSALAPITSPAGVIPEIRIAGSDLTARASQTQLLADAEALIAQLEGRRQSTTQDIRQTTEALSAQLGSGQTSLISSGADPQLDDLTEAVVRQLDQDIRELSGQVQEYTAKRDELTRALELSRSAADLLMKRAVETRLAANAASGRALVISGASSARPSGPSSALLAAGFVGGLLAGLVLAVVVDRRRAARTAAPAWSARPA